MGRGGGITGRLRFLDRIASCFRACIGVARFEAETFGRSVVQPFFYSIDGAKDKLVHGVYDIIQ